MRFLNHLAQFRPILAAAFFLLTVGCQYAVKIEHPKDGTYTAPIKTFSVKFHNDFQPGTFQANLNGQTITNLFHPTPAPGNVSTATIQYPNYMDFHYNNNKQHLVVDGEYTTPTSGLSARLTRDSSDFTPPYVRIFRGTTGTDTSLTLREGETITATAFMVAAPKERTVVRITGSSLVSLNDRPAGEDIEVIIEPNDRRAPFRVRGIQSGGEVFRLRAIATGYSSGIGGGYVTLN